MRYYTGVNYPILVTPTKQHRVSPLSLSLCMQAFQLQFPLPLKPFCDPQYFFKYNFNVRWCDSNLSSVQILLLEFSPGTVVLFFVYYILVVYMCCVSAEEVLEQADYLYSCAETEKLYQLLLQYKDR